MAMKIARQRRILFTIRHDGCGRSSAALRKLSPVSWLRLPRVSMSVSRPVLADRWGMQLRACDDRMRRRRWVSSSVAGDKRRMPVPRDPCPSVAQRWRAGTAPARTRHRDSGSGCSGRSHGKPGMASASRARYCLAESGVDVRQPALRSHQANGNHCNCPGDGRLRSGSQSDRRAPGDETARWRRRPGRTAREFALPSAPRSADAFCRRCRRWWGGLLPANHPAARDRRHTRFSWPTRDDSSDIDDDTRL